MSCWYPVTDQIAHFVVAFALLWLIALGGVFHDAI